MGKPIFLEVKGSSAKKKTLHAMPGQFIMNKAKGTKVAVKSTWSVIPHQTSLMDEVEVGDILATSGLMPKDDRGYYVAGTEMVVLIHEGAPTNSNHSRYDDWSKAFETFLASIKEEEEDRENVKKRTPLISLMKATKELAPPTVEEDGFYVETETWYRLLRAMKRRKSIVLVGPTGTGKTELAELMADMVGKPRQVFDMAISNPNTALCGNHRINSKGQSEFQLARFAQEIQKENLIILDELSRAHPASNNILFPVLDRRRTLFVENAMETALLKVHDETVFWATANIGMQYVGTATLDHALMNRFLPVEIGYPPPPIEEAILVKRANVSRMEASVIVDFANQVRGHVDITKDISTRQTIEIAEAVFDGMTIPEAVEFCVLYQYSNDETGQGERSVVSSIMQGL